jgi:hypothetical protein
MARTVSYAPPFLNASSSFERRFFPVHTILKSSLSLSIITSPHSNFTSNQFFLNLTIPQISVLYLPLSSYVLRRYRVIEGRPEHTSATCFVYRAVDEGETGHHDSLSSFTSWIISLYTSIHSHSHLSARSLPSPLPPPPPPHHHPPPSPHLSTFPSSSFPTSFSSLLSPPPHRGPRRVQQSQESGPQAHAVQVTIPQRAKGDTDQTPGFDPSMH